MEFFETERAPAGDLRFAIALGPLRIELDGLDAPLLSAIEERWGPWRAPGMERGRGLRIRVAREARDYFIAPPEATETHPVLLACDGDRVRLVSYRAAGWFDTDDGEGRLLLSDGEFESRALAMENYIRAAVGWQSLSRGGALVHSSSAVLDGRGYLFYGESGAGKSTLVSVNTRARVLSDELSLVMPDDGGVLHVVGTPFRTDTALAPVVGAFPLAAGFRLVKADVAKVCSVPRSVAMAELVGSLPFVAEFFSRRSDLFERLEQSFSGLPLARLNFRKDDSYWDAIADAGL
jgi:hypothetical protein